ncbi:MAG: c-type cytochrome [Acidobacteriota bacterium]
MTVLNRRRRTHRAGRCAAHAPVFRWSIVVGVAAACLVLTLAAGPVSESSGESAAAGGAGWSLPVPDLDYNAREGRALFAHYCVPCHGVEGRGDGFNAYNLDPRPRDLASETVRQASDDDLSAVIAAGGALSGLSTGMPPWGRTLTRRQIGNIIVYVRELGRRAAAAPPEED